MSTTIPIGPFHPVLEEPEYISLYVDGETVTGADIDLGRVHRGIELLAQEKTYDQDTFLVERICGICSASHCWASVLAMEDIAGVGPSDRARYLRTIVHELERLHSHMLWVGLGGHILGYWTVFMWGWKYREPILDALEAITGNRNNYAWYRPGGVRRDVADEIWPGVLKILDDFDGQVDLLTGAILDDPVILGRLKGVGILTTEDAIKYGALGPTARGSGVDIDVRRDEPYGAYSEVDWNVIVQDGCDCLAVAVVRLLEMKESVKIVRQCIEKLPGGPIANEIREIPRGEGVGHIEAPRGESFHFIRSNGTNMPERHKIRAPTFNNIPTYRPRVVGETIADACLIFAIIDPCYSCTERMAVLGPDGRPYMGGKDLIALSHAKTEALRKSS
ncbi:MAG: nickel-dependent hydrogenase large subunit [Candidatus Eisenbacteria bacterium]